MRVPFLVSGPLGVKGEMRFAGSSFMPGSFFPIIQPVFPFLGISLSLAQCSCSLLGACTLYAVQSIFSSLPFSHSCGLPRQTDLAL